MACRARKAANLDRLLDSGWMEAGNVVALRGVRLEDVAAETTRTADQFFRFA